MNFKLLKLNKKCLLLSFVLLSLLVYIALFINDQFIRPFLGDVLVVIWLYLFLNSFIKLKKYKLAHLVLLFSYLVETAQFFNLVALLGLQNIKIARIIIGTTFDWFDIIAYTVGWILILLIELFNTNQRTLTAKK